MTNEAIRQFIKTHRREDVRQLALKYSKRLAGDLPFVLDQIRGWQTARYKIPLWAAMDDIVYPPHLSIEQCSSETTARYKASIAGSGRRFVDLTGGMGVDFSWMSLSYEERIYVERNPELCALARNNFKALGLDATIIHDEAENYLKKMDSVDTIFLDPSRRDSNGNRTYDISDCTPNILTLLPLLLQKSRRVIIKLSPMLDWHQAVVLLGPIVSQVHIISVSNECKELLFVLDSEKPREMTIHCVNDEQEFIFHADTHPPVDSHSLEGNASALSPTESPQYLYEPNASIMKAGCFNLLSQRFQVKALAPNSHLFIADTLVSDFPGRTFSIITISSLGKQSLRQHLSGIKKANITIRNFPESAAALRKRLKITDGGDIYLFATTLSTGDHRLFICKKVKS